MSGYLETKNLSVGYHGKPLIKDVSLCVQRGKIVTLIGPNGSGKSTILKTVIGQLPELSGTVYLDGETMPQRCRAAHGDLDDRARRTGAHDLPRCGQLGPLSLHGKARRPAGRR